MGCRRRSVCLERLGNRWGGGGGWIPFFGGGRLGERGGRRFVGEGGIRILAIEAKGYIYI